MKRTPVVALIIILLGLHSAYSQGRTSGTTASPPERASKPAIFVEQPAHDFGHIDASKKVSYIFKVRNRGTAPLEITNVFSDCDCTVGTMRSSTIPPSGVGELVVSFDAPRYKNTPGKKVRHLIISSNDPDHPEVELTVRAFIDFVIAVAPEVLYFEDVPKGSAQTKALFLFEGEGTEVNLVNVISDLDFISVSAPSRVTNPRRGYRLDVTLDKGAPVGSFRGMITITTDRADRPEIKVPLAGRVLGHIRVDPQHFSFGLVRRGRSKSKTIEVRRVDRKPFQITDVEFPARLVSVETTVQQRGKKYLITVALKPTVSTGRYHEKLKIHTNDPEEPVLVVPFYLVVW